MNYRQPLAEKSDLFYRKHLNGTMSIDSQIDPELNVIVRIVTGKVDVSDITNAFYGSLTRAEFKKDMHVIWNLNDTDASDWGEEKFIGTIKLVRKNTKRRGSHYKIAIVAQKSLTFGIARMLESYAYELPQSIRVLKSMDDAYDWIVGPGDMSTRKQH